MHLFLVPPGQSARALLLLESSNVPLKLIRKQRGRIGVAAVWTNEGHEKSLGVAESIPVTTARCRQMLLSLKADGSLGPVSLGEREWEENTVSLEFRLARQPSLADCTGSVRAIPMD